MVGNVASLGRRLLRVRKTKTAWQTSPFSSQTSAPPPLKNSFAQPSLEKPLPGIGGVSYASQRSEDHITQVTTLPNGLRVATENRFGSFCTVGVVVECGSRFEVAFPSGVSHFLEKLAFNSTSIFEDKDKILQSLEKNGGICDCLSSRDTFVYATSAERKGLDNIVKILSEVLLRPKLKHEEVEIAKQHISFELENLMTRPEQEIILSDMIHAAAYRDNTLGLPKLCPAENLEKINRQVLFSYLKSHFTPERMVIAGVGVDHQELVNCVQKYFVETLPIWESDTNLILPGIEGKVDKSIAQYTGGMVQEKCKIPQHFGPSGLPELAHMVIGLESCSHQDPDFIAMCVLSVIMGGGGSFSAGGPGKGMYTRLYTNVLNRYHWLFSATSYNQTYNDTGLFYIHGSCPPKYVGDMVEVLTKEMANMVGPVDIVELRRAKTQLQSMVLMNLEVRPVVFEDIARQVLATGKRKIPIEFIREIEKITSEDIERVATRLLRSLPCVTIRGDVDRFPSLSQTQALLTEPKSNLKGRLSLFT